MYIQVERIKERVEEKEGIPPPQQRSAETLHTHTHTISIFTVSIQVDFQREANVS